MRFVDEYRHGTLAKKYLDQIAQETTQSWTIMEICGGQTHTIVKSGLDTLLPSSILLVHGPGCPVCVTPVELIDKAAALASRTDILFTSFGDMLRVPGSEKDLLSVKACGGDIHIVASPLDALQCARHSPEKEIVFFAVGFETTAPATAFAIRQAQIWDLKNFSVLCAHVLVPPAMELILSSPSNRIQGFLAAGHVCTITGFEEYRPLAEKFHVPIVVTGFEPVDILQGILMTIQQLEHGRSTVENQYARSVRPEGNQSARKLLQTVFQITNRSWRGIGPIPNSGFRIRDEFSRFDAEQKFDVTAIHPRESASCIAGQVLQGLKKPFECPEFGTRCDPEHPLGAPMVSSEGACAAYYHYNRTNRQQ